MGAEENWNHPAFFDYEDRVMTEDLAPFQAALEERTGRPGGPGTKPRPDSFVGRMWDTYRKDCGPLFGARDLMKAASKPVKDSPK